MLQSRIRAEIKSKQNVKISVFFIFLILFAVASANTANAQCSKKKTRDFINQGNESFRRNQFAKAAESYQKATGNEPNCADAYFNLGQAQRLLNQYDLALGSLERAFNLNYQDKAANHLAMAAVYWIKGSGASSKDLIGKALNHAVNAIKINDKLTDAWIIIASANRNLGDAPGELNALEQIVRLEPNNLNARREKALAHYRIKDYDRSVAEFEQLVKFDPRNLNNYLALSDLYRIVGKNSAAMDAASRAYALKPDSPAVLFNLGGAFLALNGYDKAIEAFQKAIDLKTEYLAESYYYIASAQMIQGKYGEAVENLKKSLQQPAKLYPADRFNATVYKALATSYGQTADFNQAINYLLKIKQSKLDDSDLNVELSWWYSLLGQDDKALEAATIAIEKNSKNAAAYTNRCRANFNLKKITDAANDCKSALGLSPNNGETLFYYSRVLRDSKRVKEADEHLKRAIDLLEKELGAKNAAEESAVKKDIKKDDSERVFVSKTEVKRQQSTSEIDEGNDLLVVNVSPFTPYILGNAYVDSAQYPKAISAYKLSIQRAPNFPLARVNLAYVYLYRKEKQAALGEYAELLKIDRKRAEDLKKVIDGR